MCTSSRSASRLKKDLVTRRHVEAGPSSIPSGFKGIAWSDPSKSEDVLSPSVYCQQKGKFERTSAGHVAEASSRSPIHRGVSAEAMFLDFESVRIMKEDSDEDSASDLSDSERIPIPPSPCTPPELNLRAEEIDPLCFEHVFDTKLKRADYYYPDFLPPPFNSWDLKGLATFVNTECKSEMRPRPEALLEKYIDRLLELEWLQMQTIQSEKGKAAKARPQTAPGVLRTLKSPGKTKSWHSPLPNKQLTPRESFPRLPTGHSGHRRDLHGEGTSQVLSCRGRSKAAEATCGPPAPERRPYEVRSEAKKQPPTKQQLPSTNPSENSLMIQGAGNIRPPKQSSAFHSSAIPLRGPAAYPCPNPKKTGNSSNYIPSKKASTDKKLKANGVKQAPCKFK